MFIRNFGDLTDNRIFIFIFRCDIERKKELSYFLMLLSQGKASFFSQNHNLSPEKHFGKISTGGIRAFLPCAAVPG